MTRNVIERVLEKIASVGRALDEIATEFDHEDLTPELVEIDRALRLAEQQIGVVRRRFTSMLTDIDASDVEF